jgi:hypothetical protein
MNIRIRYGRDPGNYSRRKNTLATVRKGDLIYFAIAKCNSKLDKFDQTMGKMKAYERLVAILAEHAVLGGTPCGTPLSYFMVTPDGAGGYVTIDNIRKLLQYFEGIDKKFVKPWPNLYNFGAIQLK